MLPIAIREAGQPAQHVAHDATVRLVRVTRKHGFFSVRDTEPLGQAAGLAGVGERAACNAAS